LQPGPENTKLTAQVLQKPMNVGLFGGSFDPIHRGHVALAQAAAERFGLKQVLFVPANVPPHKQSRAVTPYFHRYAMVVLATMGEKAFVSSLTALLAEVLQALGWAVYPYLPHRMEEVAAVAAMSQDFSPPRPPGKWSWWLTMTSRYENSAKSV
jgi:cytidyltransferase-like protein